MKLEVEGIDLFCGVGGLTHGLIKSGIKVKLGVDTDPACEYPYTANNKSSFLLKSVESINKNELLPFYSQKSIKLLAGCAPCQTFSTYNRKSGKGDSRWWLLSHFSRLISQINPELVTMENVPGLADQDIFKHFIDNLTKIGYSCAYQVVSCSDYGIPQVRKRLVTLASKLGPISILSPAEFNSKPRDVMAAIGKFLPIKAGVKNFKDPLHQSASLSKLNLARIRASSPGGTWRDWPTKLVANCHSKKSGKTYPSVYGRMKWEEPSPTITTQFFGYGNGRFGHPEQDRAISLREGSVLQSFPKSYKFLPPNSPVHMSTIGRLIGNAVPVRLGYMIGRSFNEHLSKII